QLELRGDGVEDLARHRHRAEAVRVAGVRRAGERQVREPELLDVPQALVLRAVDQRPLIRGELDGAMDGIADVHQDGGPALARAPRTGPLRSRPGCAPRRPAALGTGRADTYGRRSPTGAW